VLSVVLVLLAHGAGALAEDSFFPAQNTSRSVTSDQWASYYATGKLAEAKAAFDNGKLRDALKTLETIEPTLASRFLLGLTLMKLNEHPKSAATFEALAADYPAMREWCLLHAAWSFETARDWPKAESTYQLLKESSLAVEAAVGLSHVYKRTKRFSEARAVLEPLVESINTGPGRSVAAEALWALADVEALAGNTRAQQKALLSLYSKYPASPYADQVDAKIDAPYSALTLEQKVTRAEGLVDIHQNAVALALLQQLMTTKGLGQAVECRIGLAIGRAQRKLRTHAAAIVTLSKVVKKCTEPELVIKALSLLGYSQSLSSPRQAKLTYLKVVDRFAAHPLADDALFAAAEQAERSHALDEAAQLFIRLVNEYPTSEFAGESFFHLFSMYAQAGDSETARSFLAEASARFANAADSYEAERADYWRGVFELQAGNSDAAKALFRELSEEHPMSYYGLLARERLKSLGVALDTVLVTQSENPSSSLFPITLEALGTDQRFATAVELARLQMTDELMVVTNQIDRATLSERDVLALSVLLSTAGQVRAAHQVARLWLKKALSGTLTAESAAAFQVAYPLAFRELVVEHSGSSLDADLLQGLMREESALDAKVMSWAGAYGLCQLMPRTAAGVARTLKLKRPTPAQLLDPSLNLRLGAKYLSGLLSRYRQVKPFAIASYNAGEAAVDKWNRARPNVELDQWIEEIPLQETRGYVKRVLRSYNTYKLLYQRELVTLTDLPPASIEKPK
jgi:soluble lytic murein transglycosylase